MPRSLGPTKLRKLVALVAASLILGACGSDGQDATPGDEPSDVALAVSGTYKAEIPFRDFSEVPGETIKLYEGEWKIVLDVESSTYSIEKDGYGRVSGALAGTADKLMFDDPPAPEGAFNCYIDGERTLTEGAGDYRFTIEDPELTLSVEDDPCPLRAAILERIWTRSGG
jgi:hypothetical protein